MRLFRIFYSVFSLFLVVILSVQSENVKTKTGVLNTLSKIYLQCEHSVDLFKCLKLYALKFTNRAVKVQNFKLIDGLSIIKKQGYRGVAEQRSNTIDNNNSNNLTSDENDLKNLSTQHISELLLKHANEFINNHQIEISVPRIMSSVGKFEIGKFFAAATNTEDEATETTEAEGRKGSKKKEKYLGPFMAAIALKAGMLKMAYHSIAIIAGKALIVGKIALIISAIIGLKKLVSPGGHEKTTYEIVKHPHIQQSQTYSSSSHSDYDTHDSGNSGHYHRSLADNDMLMQDRVYRSHVVAS